MASRDSSTGWSRRRGFAAPRPLRMHASSDDDDLRELVYPEPQPRDRPAGRGRSRRRKNSTPRRFVPYDAGAPAPAAQPVVPPPPVVQEQQQPPRNHVIYILGCPPDVMVATGDGPAGRTVAGFLCRTIAPPAGAGDDGIFATMIMCTCHGRSFTPASFLLHAGATDVSYPESKIKAYPWLGGVAAPPPPGNGSDQ